MFSSPTRFVPYLNTYVIWLYMRRILSLYNLNTTTLNLGLYFKLSYLPLQCRNNTFMYLYTCNEQNDCPFHIHTSHASSVYLVAIHCLPLKLSPILTLTWSPDTYSSHNNLHCADGLPHLWPQCTHKVFSTLRPTSLYIREASSVNINDG